MRGVRSAGGQSVAVARLTLLSVSQNSRLMIGNEWTQFAVSAEREMDYYDKRPRLTEHSAALNRSHCLSDPQTTRRKPQTISPKQSLLVNRAYTIE